MDAEDRIDRLCVMAGIIMGDASVGAITTNPSRNERVANLYLASKTIRALARAANFLVAHLSEER